MENRILDFLRGCTEPVTLTELRRVFRTINEAELSSVLSKLLKAKLIRTTLGGSLSPGVSLGDGLRVYTLAPRPAPQRNGNPRDAQTRSE